MLAAMILVLRLLSLPDADARDFELMLDGWTEDAGACDGQL